MVARRKPRAANKHAQQVGGLAQRSVARSPTMRKLVHKRRGDSTMKELFVVLERLDESLISLPRITTPGPLKRTAASAARRLDFSKSESRSDEHEPQTKRQKLSKAEHSSPSRLTKGGLIQHIPTPKSSAVRARQNGADFTYPARKNLSSSGDDDSSYHLPTETDTISTLDESNSEWEEFTSDGTSSTVAEISKRSSSSASTRAKRDVNRGTSSSRRLRRLRVKISGSKLDNIRARASWQAHPRRPATRKPLYSDDNKVERRQKKATSQTSQKAASKGKPRATEKQVACSLGAKYVARHLKVVEQDSSGSWEESSSVESTDDTESLTDSRDKKTRLRIVERKKQTRPLTPSKKKKGRHITKSKVEAAKRKRTPQRSLNNSDMDSERSQEKDTTRGGKRSLPAKRDGTQRAMKNRKTFDSTRKRKRSSSSSRKSEVPSQPGDSELFLFAARNAQTRSSAKAHGGYADRRKSLRARRESMLSSQYSSDSSGDNDGKPSRLQRNAVSQSIKADIPVKRQAVNGSYIRLARKSTKAPLSEEESASSDSSEEWLAVQSPRTGNIHVKVRGRMTRNKTTRVKEKDEMSHDAITSSEGSRDDITYSKRIKVTKLQSRQLVTRKQPKPQAFVEVKKKGKPRSPLVTGVCGESSHDHSSASQNSSDGLGSNWKSVIVQRSKRGVSSTHQGPKRSHAHPIRLTKKSPIKRKRHPSSSGSSHSTKGALTTESESSQISARDLRAESSASKQRSLKSGIGATQGTGNPVTRRSLIRTERDNNLAARKQLQTVVVKASIRHMPRGSSVVSGTMHDSSSKLKSSQKNKVTQSKAVLSVQQGPQENPDQLKAVTSTRKKSARGNKHSSTEELVTSELETEEDKVGLQSPRVHSAGRALRLLQLKTDVAKGGRKNMVGGSPARTKDGDKSLRGSSSISEAGSDSSGEQKKAAARSQPENLPSRNRLRQRTAVPIEKARATRSSLKAASRTFSPDLSVGNLRRQTRSP